MSQITFIVLTYFPNPQTLRRLLDALGGYPVALVDNTSDPKSDVRAMFGEKDIKLPSNVYLISNGENKGYAGGVNIGLRHAYGDGARWITILNDDVQMSDDSLKTFCKEIISTKAGLAGPYPRRLDPKRWTTLSPNEAQPDTDRTSFQYLSGSFLAVHRDVIGSIGYLFEPYFIFYEEVEYCLRARRAGFPLTYITLPALVHKESSTFANRTFLHSYYLARNHLLFVERNAPAGVRLHELLRLPKTILEHSFSPNRGGFSGIRDYLLRRFGPHKESI